MRGAGPSLAWGSSDQQAGWALPTFEAIAAKSVRVQYISEEKLIQIHPVSTHKTPPVRFGHVRTILWLPGVRASRDALRLLVRYPLGENHSAVRLDIHFNPACLDNAVILHIFSKPGIELLHLAHVTMLRIYHCSSIITRTFFSR